MRETSCLSRPGSQERALPLWLEKMRLGPRALTLDGVTFPSLFSKTKPVILAVVGGSAQVYVSETFQEIKYQRGKRQKRRRLFLHGARFIKFDLNRTISIYFSAKRNI
ncbi:hypothetical protein BDV37DRAFT_263076 [Aspergillus pseudonomiae]|uniref:Uncharacterized protein n=1 Tax=Aspergillus pseudonomiae TaxID=1506151 RepID=A0A5N7CYB0_9EURO|nr:uncharacterized protein BDV37DRAFT_263076 [Aspergillus pseudonomiae]KAE8398563.1 hypothetical protein BDV37DRAFT_263076 [Aspergillus pseudonomiae]